MDKICKICKRLVRYDKGCWRHIEGGGVYWQRCRECDWEGKLTVDDLLTKEIFFECFL